MATILVIDDDITIQLTLKKILIKQGYDVEIASDGEAGLAKAIELQPAVIVCDWMMPGMKGPEVCQRVKARPELSASFFILLTAYDSVEDIVRGLDAGADDFLTKPPEISELKARIRTGCRSFELRQELQAKHQEVAAGLQATATFIQGLLPPPIKSPQLSFCGEWVKGDRLSGTGIVGRWLNDEAFAFGLLDTPDVGIPSALNAAQWMLAISRPGGLPDVDLAEPEQVLEASKHYIDTLLGQDNHPLNLWYGIYRPSKKTLSYSNTGHSSAVLVDSQGASRMAAPKSSKSTKLKAGSTIYLATHHLITGAPDAAWGEQQYLKYLSDAHSKASEQESAPSTVISTIRKKRDLKAFDRNVALVQLRMH